MKEILTDNFRSAALDYFWLQEKEYPQRLVYKIVCDRYKLNTLQRVVLYRGIFPSREVQQRKLKQIINPNSVNLSVDVTNVIFKLSNYLCGRPVFLCNDNLLRDAGDAFDKDYNPLIIKRAVQLMVDYLVPLSLLSITFLIDKPTGAASLIHSELQGILSRFIYPVSIKEVYPADHFLEGPEPAAVATADSEVIDRLSFHFLDIPRQVLDKHFQPEYLNIAEILRQQANPPSSSLPLNIRIK